MRPGIGRNVSCALGDCFTSRPKSRLWSRELWFSIYSCTYVYIHIHVGVHVWPEEKNTQQDSYMHSLVCTYCCPPLPLALVAASLIPDLYCFTEGEKKE